MNKVLMSKYIRRVFISEGISYLVLLGIAMPLKYFANIPQAVKIVGWIHGGLFMMFMAGILLGLIFLKWSFFRALVAFAASLVPFGTFILDKELKKEEILMDQSN